MISPSVNSAGLELWSHGFATSSRSNEFRRETRRLRAGMQKWLVYAEMSIGRSTEALRRSSPGSAIMDNASNVRCANRNTNQADNHNFNNGYRISNPCTTTYELSETDPALQKRTQSASERSLRSPGNTAEQTRAALKNR
jgi:hypothetical protein